ncbi:hypothetical protein H1V43_23015 [Streptomyces sp. PSKA54]|uniref:Cytochrome C oxidase subunit I n=1 Tax=Streptomyces himalayensis subsp. aureolus TaxID=2758039 RepID=A0A7W2D3X1_9ACTN|nr:hypothetical protein [Streptomyces himalayensis]MBA4864174.1 hypothetical protein [Streptomyces himalayensis subsp. aureolus]
MSRRPPEDAEAAAGIAQLEGYLLCQAEIRTARAEGDAFARRMAWLTTAQHEEVARHYADERLALSKELLGAVAARCVELQDEYEARYLALRQRLLCRCVALLLVSCALSAAAGFLTLYR